VYHPFRHDGVSSVLLDVWGLFTGCRILKRTAENCFDKKRNTVFADVPNSGFTTITILNKKKHTEACDETFFRCYARRLLIWQR
jgi:hypothetical protein